MNAEAIRQLEGLRESKILVYVTGDKPPIFHTKVANDILPLFREVLEGLPAGTKKISLLLNTKGGNLDTPWPLVNLIREYCEEFEVIVPENALSAGTLIALGADRIIMLPYSHLSPIDPATEIVDMQKKEQKRIEIEDIIGYINFAKEKIGIKAQSTLGEVMRELTKEINPALLGSVNRTHSLIRSLAKNLLFLHKTKPSKKQINLIINHLTEELFSHKHLINRREASKTVGFGDIIEFADEKTKRSVDSLFKHYKGALELDRGFNAGQILGSEDKKEFKLARAIVSGAGQEFSFISNYLIVKPDGTGGKIAINNTANNWQKTS